MPVGKDLYARIPTIFYVGICLIGLLYQMYEINDVYFKYPVRSGVIVRMPQQIHFDAVSLCTRYIDVLDYDKMNRVKNTTWRYSLDDEEIRSLQDSVSLKEIFDFTPDEGDVIKRGHYRTPGTYVVQQCHHDNCSSVFDVVKFYYLEYICYRISLRKETTMSLTSLTETSVSSGLLMRITFSDSIDRSLRIVITTHGPRLFPFRSLLITPVIVRGSKRERMQGKAVRFSRFASYQRRMSTRNLPSPYETNCFDYRRIGFHSDVQCLQQCIMNQTRVMTKRLPFSVILTPKVQGQGLHVISYRDTLNPVLMDRVMRIEKECYEVTCRWSPCDKRIALTVTSMTSHDSFESEIRTPIKPSVTIIVRPMMDLTEFFIFLMSIISTWTGLYVIQMDPFR